MEEVYMRSLSIYLKNYKKESILAPFFKFLEVVFDLLVPVIIARMIDVGIAQNNRGVIVQNFFLLILMAAAGLTVSITAQYFAAKASAGFACELRQAVFDHVQNFSYTELDRLGTDTLITRLTGDINQVQNGVNMGLRLLLRSPFIVLGSMVMAFTINLRCALIFAAAIPILFLVVFAIMYKSIPLYGKVQKKLDRVTGLTRENLTGVRVIRAFCREKEAVEEWAKEARARLSIGDMCPVCGQKIEVLSKDEDFQSMLAPIRQSLEAKEKEYKEAEQALNSNRAEVKTYENMITNSRLATEKTRKGHDLARTEAEEQCSRCSISSISDNTKEILEKLFQENKLNLENVNAKLNEIQTLSNHISRLQHLKDNHQKAVEAARNALDTADKNLTKLKNDITNKHSLAESEKEIVRTTLERVSPLILWEGWQTEWQTSPTAFIERLQKSAEHYKLAQNRQAELKAAIALIDKELSSISATQELICTAFPEWRHLTAKEKMEIKNLGMAWNTLNSEVGGLKQNILSVRKNLDELQASLTTFYTTHPDMDEARLIALSSYSNEQIESLRSGQQRLREEEVAAQTAFRLTTGQLEEHQSKKPEMEEEETLESLDSLITALDEKITAGNQTLLRLKIQLEENAKNIARIKDEKKRADELREVYLKWDRLCHHFGDEKGTNFRNIAQSFVLKELLNGANFYLQRLTERYELECQAGSLTILLRDLYQGGAARPACTLSGGESFLVSLSLALGLSSLSRHSLSVDTLFIDEGFGTLSSDYLNTVMDTLEKLHQMGGKKVGIISHVEGLRERIKTQIQVKRIDNSRSEITTVRTL